MQIEEMIINNYEKLNETDLIIWRYVTNHKKSCSKISINDLADSCNVSRTTITRFVRKIGLSGFSEFKVLLNWELNNIQIKDTKAFERACDSIIFDIEDLKKKNFDVLCKLMYESERVYVYGSGDIQNAVAKQMKRMFLSCEEVIFDFGGVTFDKAFYNVVRPTDLVFLISLSGESKEIVEVAKNLRAKGAKIISITEFQKNTVADLSNESLYISATNLKILDRHPKYKITMMYFVVIELFFIKYSIFKNNRMISEGNKSES